jgi:hypothetical protein
MKRAGGYGVLVSGDSTRCGLNDKKGAAIEMGDSGDVTSGVRRGAGVELGIFWP